MKRYIIFDFDRTIGTLIVDWHDWRKEIFNLITKEFNQNANLLPEQIKHAGQNDLIKKYGAEFREKLNKINEIAETNLVTDFVANKPILDFIQNTERILYCWSSNSRATLDRYMHKLGIKNKFKKIISREDVFLLKPDTEGFKYIYTPGARKKDYVFIGDSDVDKDTAEACGIEFLHVDDFRLEA